MKHILRVTIFKDGKDLSTEIVLREFSANDYDILFNQVFPQRVENSPMNNEHWVAVFDKYTWEEQEEDCLVRNGWLTVVKQGKYTVKTLQPIGYQQKSPQ